MRHHALRALAILVLASLIPACGGGSGGGGGGGGGTFVSGLTFTTKGGKGATGAGGDGGSFDVQGDDGGDVSVRHAGFVNVGVATPKQTPYLGTNPMVISTNFTLSLTSAVATGQLNHSDGLILNLNGTVTGIWVKPGATLTIRPNATPNGIAPHTSGNLDLPDGVLLEGTIQVGLKDDLSEADGAGVDPSDLNIVCGGVWIASTGKLDLSGANNVAGPGSNGGYLTIDCDAFYSAGDILTRGGNGSTNGGLGGGIDIGTNVGYAISTGSLTTDGGIGSGGFGGDGGDINLESRFGYGIGVFKGTFSSVGGNGTTDGGLAGAQYYYTDYGVMICSGQFHSFGGDSTVDGVGGSGNTISVDAYGQLRVLGTLDSHGGNGAGAGDGSGAGAITLNVWYDTSLGSGNYSPDSNGVWFGANVLAYGGDGTSTGNGGDFSISQNASGSSTTSQAHSRSSVNLLGYSKIDLSGGDGYQDGGNAGGTNYLEASNGTDDASISYAGSVYNEADFLMRGGKGTTGAGGNGQDLNMETTDKLYPPYDYGLENRGTLDARGGDGANGGGTGGAVSLFGKTYLKNSGMITTQGGSGGIGIGGSAAEIDLYSDGPLASSGSLVASGGDSNLNNGGVGDQIKISTANICTVTGSLAANGGNSGSAIGGDGGTISIMSQEDLSKITASLSVTAGSGAAGTPVDGEIWIDGLQVVGP